jgi:hypothetical protein
LTNTSQVKITLLRFGVGELVPKLLSPKKLEIIPLSSNPIKIKEGAI